VRHAAEPSGWSCNGLLNYNAAALCVLPELMREAQRQFLVLFVNNSPQREEQTGHRNFLNGVHAKVKQIFPQSRKLLFPFYLYQKLVSIQIDMLKGKSFAA
jgi:hypothetical protein